MGYGVNAENVLRKDLWKKRLIGLAIGAAFFMVIELYLIYNYLSYKAANGAVNGDILTAFASLTQLFTIKSISLPFGISALVSVASTWASIWWINLLLLVLLLLMMSKVGNFKGVEYGSATWAGKAERQAFSICGNNIPIQDGMWLNPDNSELKNLNELVVGDSGAGKTFQKLIPDILQLVGSYIITDTKGALYRQLSKLLINNGYKIRVLNLIDPLYSNTFNPLIYIHDDTDIDKLANTFVVNSRREGAGTGEGFWEDTIVMLLSAIFSYLVREDLNPVTLKPESKTFTRVTDLLSTLEVINGKIAPYCELEEIMGVLEQKYKTHPAVLKYKLFKSGAGDTMSSIIISVGSRIQAWTSEKIRVLTNSDEMDIDSIGTEKTAIFLIIPDTVNPYKCISSMFISLVFSRLYYIADYKCNGPLPLMVSCELDEFANCGTIPNFDTYISTMRSRNIRAMIVLQNLQQLEKNYEKADKSIASNCLVFNYLGTNDLDTRKKVVEMLDKTTIEETNNSRNTGVKGNSSESDKGLGRDLLTISELSKVSNKKSIVMITGYNPFYGSKIKTWKHPLFSQVGNDFKKNNPNNTNIFEAYKELSEKHIRDYSLYANGVVDEQSEQSNDSDSAQGQQLERTVDTPAYSINLPDDVTVGVTNDTANAIEQEMDSAFMANKLKARNMQQ